MHATYHIKNPSSGLVRDVVETPKQLVINYAEGKPVTIHLWRASRHSIQGELVQANDPECCVILLEEEVAGQNVPGIDLPLSAVLQAVTGLAFKACEFPINAEDLHVPELPAELRRAILTREETDADYRAKVEALEQVKRDLEEAEAQLLQRRATIQQEQEAAVFRAQELDAKVYELTVKAGELDSQVTILTQTVETLNTSIAEKSEESTQLALRIEQQKASIGA